MFSNQDHVNKGFDYALFICSLSRREE